MLSLAVTNRLWLVNVWLFWPHVRASAEATADPVLRRCAVPRRAGVANAPR